MPVAVATTVLAPTGAPAWLAAAALAGACCAFLLDRLIRHLRARSAAVGRGTAAPSVDEVEEEVLRATRAFLDALPDPVWSISVADMRVVYRNAVAAAAWGEGGTGAGVLEVLEHIDAPDREKVRALLEAGAAGQAGHMDVLATLPDGTRQYLHCSITPIRDSRGKVRRVIVQAHDVTQHWAHEAAREALEAYRRTFAGSPIGLFRSTVSGRLIDANQSLIRQLGYPDLDTMLKRPTTAAYADPSIRQEILARVQREGVVTGAEVLLVRYDGSRFWGRLSLRAAGGEGAESYLEGSIEDIDEQKRVSEALRQAEERYRDLVDMSPDGILVHVGGRVVYANEAATRMFGAERSEQLIGKPVAEMVAPEYRDRVQERIATLLGAGKPVPALVERLLRLDGSSFMAEVVARPMTYQGVRAVQLVARDATSRMEAEEAVRKSEARFRALMENSWDAITVLQPDGKLIYESPVGIVGDPAGYQRFEATGFPDVHPDDRARVRAAWEAILRDPNGSATVQFRLTRDGVDRTLESRFRNLLSNPDIGAIVINTRDLTERVRLEEDLRQAQKMEAVGRLAGGVAHDFNNILTAITGNARLLLEDMPRDDPRYAELLEIDGSAQRATALTRQLLTLSRRQVVQPELVDLNAAVAEMERMLARLIGEHISLRTRLDPGLGLVRVDPGHIQQLVLNLALNARDAMPRGGALVISTRNVDLTDRAFATSHQIEPGPYVVLAVSDKGVGIPPAELEHIFEPFFTTKEQGKGTGLGLSVVYGIARQSGGAVAVRSRPGDTEFAVYLPRAEGAAEPRPEAPPPDGGARHARILVVEDESAVRTLAARVLSRAGHEVTTAESGPAALRLLAASPTPPDLLLTDVVMPGMSGWELVSALRERMPGLRVLFMSGYAQETRAGPAMLEASAGFLEKPFSPDALRQAVEKVLRS